MDLITQLKTYIYDKWQAMSSWNWIIGIQEKSVNHISPSSSYTAGSNTHE